MRLPVAKLGPEKKVKMAKLEKMKEMTKDKSSTNRK
jgi:hypothetical protein